MIKNAHYQTKQCLLSSYTIHRMKIFLKCEIFCLVFVGTWKKKFLLQCATPMLLRTLGKLFGNCILHWKYNTNIGWHGEWGVILKFLPPPKLDENTLKTLLIFRQNFEMKYYQFSLKIIDRQKNVNLQVKRVKTCIIIVNRFTKKIK